MSKFRETPVTVPATRVLVRSWAVCFVGIGAFMMLTGCGAEPHRNVDPRGSQRANLDDDAELRPKALVTADWVASQVELGAIRILDLPYREAAYRSGHIPTAQYVDWREDIIDPRFPDQYRLPPRPQMEQLLSRLGITPGSVIVLTDDLDSRLAVRMYVTLKYFGHKNVFVLDGGNKWYKRKGFAMTDAVPEFPETHYETTETHDEYLIHLDLLKEIVDTRAAKLVDGRPFMQYSGERDGRVFHTRQPHPRRGHIPGAISIPWTSNLNDDGRFKPLPELRALYRQRGIYHRDPCVAYSNEGLHAAMTWFVLHELLGNPNVRLYDESLAEWAARDDTPLIEGFTPE